MMHRRQNTAFTLIELLVVIAIIAILAVVVVLTLNPAELLRQSRDSNRIQDMATLNSALNLYSTDQSGASGFNLGSSSVVYVSLPDPAATSTIGTNCASLGLLTLPTGYSYHCAASSTLRNAAGGGWIPVNLQNISSGNPMGSLPVDPINQSSSRLYYTYTTNGTQFEITSNIESAKYDLGGSNDIISGDGSSLATVYAKGSNLTLEPLDYGDINLVGYWPLNEGANSTAYDSSGNNMNGAWFGTQVGTSGYYSPGKVQNWAGTFDGSTDYINMGTAPGLEFGPSDFSIVLWFKPTSLCSRCDLIGHYNGGVGGYAVSEVADRTILFTKDAGDYRYSSSNALATSTWAFVVFTKQGANVPNAYINGVLSDGGYSGTGLGDIGSSGRNFEVGLNGGYNVEPSGIIGSIRVYTRALTAAQVAALYNGSK